MSDIVPNPVLIVCAIFLAKTISAGIRFRQPPADPTEKRIWEAAPEYSRLKESDPIAAERFIQNVAEEIRSNQTVEPTAGSGEHVGRTAPRQLEAISPRASSKHALGFLELVFDLLILGYITFRFPAPAIPALIAAGIAQYHSGVLLLRSLEDYLTLFLRARENSAMFWGMGGGAIGYAGLDALGVGVPAPDAVVGWRVIGGVV
jgi:hypothetical protein